MATGIVLVFLGLAILLRAVSGKLSEQIIAKTEPEKPAAAGVRPVPPLGEFPEKDDLTRDPRCKSGLSWNGECVEERTLSLDADELADELAGSEA